MTTITVTITGEGRAIGKTQLAEYMHKALRGWFPRGIERPQVVVVDAEHSTSINFHANEGIYESPVGRCVISGPKEDVRHILRLLPEPDDTYATGGVVGSGESDFAVKVRNGYASLHRVLVEALDQAQAGKGKERHNLGGGIPFERQRMQQISELIGSVDGMTYQACKKITEGVKLPTPERQVAELLGAINYIAGMIIFLRKQAAEKGAADPFDDAPAPNVITVKLTADTKDAAHSIDALRKSVDSATARAGIPGME